MTAHSRKPNVRKLVLFLALTLFWIVYVGWLLTMNEDAENIGVRLAITGLYSLTPFASVWLIERHLVRRRLSIPHGKARTMFILLPITSFLGFLLVFMVATYLFGNVLHVTQMGGLVMATEQLKQQLMLLPISGPIITIILGGAIPLIYVVTLIGAIITGWTFHGFFGLGEEYGWRGFLWEELRSLGIIRANIFIGIIWGVWHVPLILQGFDYGATAWWLSLGAITLFTTAMSFVLTAITEKTQSIIPAAALHGMMNGAIYLSVLLIIVGNPLIGGLTGIVASLIMLCIGACVWLFVVKQKQLAKE